MKIGDTVKIRECPIAKLVGENAEIAEMQFQEFEKYTVYPLWVEIASGEHKGKFYGFKYEGKSSCPFSIMIPLFCASASL